MSVAASAQDVGERASMAMKWYIVHTYAGHENKARLTLLERIKSSGLTEKFGQVLIPTESIVEVVKGKKRNVTKKFFPSYMFVQMELGEDTFHLVKNTAKVTGFLGGTNPTPVKESEIFAVSQQMTEGAAKPRQRIVFEEGDTVRVTEGPFANFSGTVEDVKQEKQKVRVLVSIFGRATPVELDFSQVEKT